MKSKTFNPIQLVFIFMCGLILCAITLVTTLEAKKYRQMLLEANKRNDCCAGMVVELSDSLHYYKRECTRYENVVDSFNILIQSNQPITIADWK